MKKLRMTAVVATFAVLTAACGGSSESGKDASTRTVEVVMKDIAFDPTTLAVKRGETVRFKFTNSDATVHDAFIGDAKAQADHETEMRASGDHGGHHMAGSGGITVKPGKTEDLTYTFKDAGSIQIGCHEPGHYAGGMKIDVTVS